MFYFDRPNVGMDEHAKNAIDKQFNKIVYLVKKLDSRLEELSVLLASGRIVDKKKVPVIQNKPVFVDFK
jgi:hypothetical protein